MEQIKLLDEIQRQFYSGDPTTKEVGLTVFPDQYVSE